MNTKKNKRFLKAINKVTQTEVNTQSIIKEKVALETRTIFLRSNKKFIQIIGKLKFIHPKNPLTRKKPSVVNDSVKRAG